MISAYDTNIDESIIVANINRLQNQIFKLLPMREEEKEWQKPLETILIEISGLSTLFPDNTKMLKLFCKIQGIYNLGEEIDFLAFRRFIFECCSLLTEIRDDVTRNTQC